jgi:hypothetical protein
MANVIKKNDRHKGVAIFMRVSPELHRAIKEMAQVQDRTIGAQAAWIIKTFFSTSNKSEVSQ